jgi:hypothetical protein
MCDTTMKNEATNGARHCGIDNPIKANILFGDIQSATRHNEFAAHA